MKNSKNILLMLMSLSIISTTLTSNKETNHSFNDLSKIKFENCSNLFMSNKEEELDNNDTNYSLTVKFNYSSITSNSFTNEEEKQIEYQRLKNYYSSMNDEFIKGIDLNQFEDIYISQYSPYFSVVTSKEELLKDSFNSLLSLSSEENIEMIYVNEINKEEQNQAYSHYTMGVNTYINTRTYTGDGVVVGLLEPGVLDKNHTNFIGYDVSVKDDLLVIENVNDHSSMMGSLITGQYGIAKECTLLSVELIGDAVSEIDWLLDNNVNIINCSYGDTTPNGEYSSKSAYMDFISLNYQVLFVASTGNTGSTNTYVANPGLGYNVLSVGACNQSGDVMKFSSYQVVDGPRKPDIVAPGNSLNVRPFSGTQYGTSFSAAFTTGCMALLLEKSPYLKYNIPSLISYASATAENKTGRPFGHGYHNYSGSGVLNFKNMCDNVDLTSQYAFNSNKIEANHYVDLESGDIFRIAINWSAYANGNVNSTSMTDYDLYIYDSNGTLIASQETNGDNKELIEFTASSTGTYTCKIIRKTTMPFTEEQVSVVHSIK